MITNKLDLIGEQTSPLFRIMWVHNVNHLERRSFENNISAFHIGNGLILSVAHNLKIERGILSNIDEVVFQTEILPHLNPGQRQSFEQFYLLDGATNTRYINPTTNQADSAIIIDLLKQINFDTRWLTLANRNFCQPHLIVQFTNDQFYNNPELTAHFNPTTYFYEAGSNRHTFLLEVELVDAYYSEDIALYRIVNTDSDIINKLPSIEADFSILEDNQEDIYCLQSAPNGFLGRLANKATIEGYLDHHGQFNDRIGGNYIFEGLRYLIKGYFRFGSSGAPYVFYDAAAGYYKVNAVQSEACPIQLSINHSQNGNFQYINALASPLHIIQERFQPHIL
jgi:hypothetical protein